MWQKSHVAPVADVLCNVAICGFIVEIGGRDGLLLGHGGCEE